MFCARAAVIFLFFCCAKRMRGEKDDRPFSTSALSCRLRFLGGRTSRLYVRKMQPDGPPTICSLFLVHRHHRTSRATRRKATARKDIHAAVRSMAWVSTGDDAQAAEVGGASWVTGRPTKGFSFRPRRQMTATTTSAKTTRCSVKRSRQA